MPDLCHPMNILKFGGTSVGSPEALKALSAIVSQRQTNESVAAVVVSAFSGVTNQLIEMARQAESGNEEYQSLLKNVEVRHVDTVSALFPAQTRSGIIAQVLRLVNELDDILNGIFLLHECSARSLDLVMSFGERLSATVVKELLELNGIPSHYLDARNVIETNRNFGAAQVDYTATFPKIQAHFSQHKGVAVTTGFIASTPQGESTTLGRGGSDFTAAILAAGLQAGEILIYTDVNGMMTADPRLVPQAFTIPVISYQEAMELSHFGAKVIYPPTLQPAFDQKIPIRILNTFDPQDPGTLITETSSSGAYAITGLSSIKEITLINVQGSGLVGMAGFASRLFSALGKEKINIILITQASSEHSITFALSSGEAGLAKAAIESEFEHEIRNGLVDPIEAEEQVSILAIVGENMKQTPGVSGKVFGALGRNGINVRATAQGSSELNISVVIPTKDLTKALNALHQTFFLSDRKKLHVFLLGPGLIGKTFLRQIADQQEFLKENLNLEIVVTGIANSRKMWISEKGIVLNEWESQLNSFGRESDITQFCQHIPDLNLPNSALVDCTSGAEGMKHYAGLLQKSIAVVTPNKLANSGLFSFYKQLKDSALKGNTRFLYETNVGAGLPVVQTLKNLIHSGDQIHRIEAMLSGTLSYIFNTFNSGVSFREVVAEAKALGYTEPDPRDDLSGKDMARKILILARESGLELEPDDVDTQNILPERCLSAPSVDAFLESLTEEDAYFKNLVTEAESEGQKLKFICKLENGNVGIRLEKIGPDHPFWNSSGADNIIAFYSARYQARPMVIQGPGAGAEVTAAGVFGDLISLAN